MVPSGRLWVPELPAAWASRFTDRAPLPYLPIEPILIAEIETDAATDRPFDRSGQGVTLVRPE
jgi:hypothetical protein